MSHHLTFRIHCHEEWRLRSPLFLRKKWSYIVANSLLTPILWEDESSLIHFAGEYNLYIFLLFYKIREQNIYCFKLSVIVYYMFATVSEQ